MEFPAPRRSSLRFILAATFVPFAAFVLFAAVSMPMSFDDAFNATMPLNLAHGRGYASSYGPTFPFNPSVSSGALFLAPVALPIALFGADMRWPMLYTAAVSLILYLFLLRSLHAHEPRAALATGILVPFLLWQGKNDPVVAGDVVPVPPYGFWYQLLGNLPGALALALAMSLLLDRAPTTLKRSLAVVALIIFAVNAKQMHIVSLACMLLVWAVLPADGAPALPRCRARLRRTAAALALLAAGWFGLWFNRVAAWLLLDAQAFHRFVASESHLLNEQGGAAKALSFLQTAPLLRVVREVVWNALHAAPFLGLALAPLLAAVVLGTTILAWRSRATSSLARLALVLIGGIAGHSVWWVSRPWPPQRHLTAIAVLACFAAGCGFGLAAAGSNESKRPRLLWRLALVLLGAAGATNVLPLLDGWGELRQYRSEQVAAAAALQRLAAEYPGASFCGVGWWVPREQTYLAPPSVELCDLADVGKDEPGRRILVLATNLWNLRKERISNANERCPKLLERVGRFEFRACDGFAIERSAAPQALVDQGAEAQRRGTLRYGRDRA